MLKTAKEVGATSLPVLSSSQEEFVWIINQAGFRFGAAYGLVEAQRQLIGRRARCRGITDISFGLIENVREHMDVGVEMRHFEGYRGGYYGIFDRKHSFTSIDIEAGTMLYTDDPVHAEYLIATFEIL